MNIIFMGTPDFAVGCLDVAVKEHNVLAVFTQPDKPKGRGYEMTPPPVKVKALEHGIPVYQPVSMRDGEAFEILKQFDADVYVVVAYGKILPKEILDLPKKGCINVHASLLPRHRGASPIQWSIVSGDKITGVTTMYMDEGMDTGDMIIKKSMDIDDELTADILHDKLAELGADCLSETLKNIENDIVIREKQQEDLVTYAPIIKKEMALIDFNDDAEKINCKIRGFNSWPCAYFWLDNKRIKVYKAKVCTLSGKAGEVLKNDGALIIGCGNNALELLEIQIEGKRRMTAAEMLRGKQIELGKIIEVK